MSIGEIGKVEKREIVYVQTFLIPKDEAVDFSFSPSHPDSPTFAVTYNKQTLYVRLKIAESGEEEISAEWIQEGVKNILLITLPAVANRLGLAIMDTPIRVGAVSGRPLGFYAAYSPSPATGGGLVTIQFTLGGAYGQ